MKTKFLLIGFAVLGFFAQGQSKLSYHFENSLAEATGAGPVLTVLGNQGIYLLDTLNEISGKTKVVYRFEKNNGVQFDNSSNFIKKTYTIELYFVFDELTSWKRVVDWKNRTTDNGAYVFEGELNFYPYIYSTTAPVVANEYTYYVITRDSTTNIVKIFTDANEEISFTDEDGDALTDVSNVLNFFYDDLDVPNEASSGAIALLNLYNYKLDTVTIRNNFNDLVGKVFGMNEIGNKEAGLTIFPNPAKDKFTVRLNNFNVKGPFKISLYNSSGLRIYFQEVTVGHNNELMLNTASLPGGIYLFRLESTYGNYSRKVVIRQ